jgi:outer membrane protein assembly factor BamB
MIAAAVCGLMLAACSGQDKLEQIKLATASAARIQDSVVDYATAQRHWPSKLEDLKVGGDDLPGVSYAVSEGGMVGIWFREGSAVPGAILRYTPTQDANGGVTWSCKAEGLEASLKPASCV